MLLFMRNGILILCEHSSQLSGPAENRNPVSVWQKTNTNKGNQPKQGIYDFYMGLHTIRSCVVNYVQLSSGKS